MQCNLCLVKRSSPIFDLVQGLLDGDFGLMLDRRAVEDPLVSCFGWRLPVLSARMDSYVIHYILDEKAVAKVSIAQSLNSEEGIDKENRRRWSKVWVAGAPGLGRHVDATRTFFGSICDSPTHFDHSVRLFTLRLPPLHYFEYISSAIDVSLSLLRAPLPLSFTLPLPFILFPISIPGA